ncbi:hypothetical protein VE01_10051 [Pseudogymnoascus verrucosus]|uniref:Uncharacterized protein n=1 Tax=Pseudogymnoascus verrucosus TaxID=342668 RepID=A0A1B8G8N3_9PEZI|nr:uncharacterized protein VE01_10051 [Pseudogymnoascus verrucosus]OBT92177.2 hypothetical protein VE01_10051 [Pseudogymnoascus verrucosus]
MSINPQTQSPFLTRLLTLPPELRDAIYLSLWRSHGLRQHIIWHGNDSSGRHFCSWPCTTDFSAADNLQRDVDELRIRLGVRLGDNMGGFGPGKDPEVSVLTRHLQSPWMNHWACGERAAEVHGIDANWGFQTAGVKCWKTHSTGGRKELVPSWSPYLPMLLSCKLLSEECLKSIYESTTFILTDLTTIQTFLGYCALHPAIKKRSKQGITPPAFFKHARSLELALMPDFPSALLCAAYDLPDLPHRHSVYDFHWLHLPRFQNLQNLNIWVSARSLTMADPKSDQSYGFTGITEHDAAALEGILTHLSPVAKVTLSTPLAPSVGPPEEEEGYLDGVKARVYKRGSGDRFHPPLYPIEPGGRFDGVIYTSPTREVRLSINGGMPLLMKKA